MLENRIKKQYYLHFFLQYQLKILIRALNKKRKGMLYRKQPAALGIGASYRVARIARPYPPEAEKGTPKNYKLSQGLKSTKAAQAFFYGFYF